jgi:hypothetical protein
MQQCGATPFQQEITGQERKEGAGTHLVLQVALSRRDVEPAVHGEHTDVEAVQLEGGAETSADRLSSERQG